MLTVFTSVVFPVWTHAIDMLQTAEIPNWYKNKIWRNKLF
jgi:hypothetical protein